MKAVSIGTLRHRVVLEAPAGPSDGAGGTSQGWSTVATLWAAIEPLSGTETLEADRVSGRITHRLVLRYRLGVVPGMRLRLATRIFEIRSVLDVGEGRRFLECSAEERDQ